jgi:hypothetical protein
MGKRGSKPRPHLCKECGCQDPDCFYETVKGRCKKCTSLKYYRTSNEKYKTQSKTWAQTAIFHYRFLSARARAKCQNLSFDIDENHLKVLWELQKGLCYYTGEQMTIKRNDPACVSVSRKKVTKGYTKENTVLCCWRINIIKSSMSDDEFIEMARKICANHPA